MFRNRQSVIKQIGLLRINLHQFNHKMGLSFHDALIEGKKLQRKPEAEVKALYAELKHEYEVKPVRT